MEKKIDFEAAVKELELIVEILENGECTLDESIELYEKGMKLSVKCAKRLEDARQKIITLTQAEEENKDND